MKTFTRARAAKAALTKILDMHEVTGVIETSEVEPGRFGAKVTFPAGLVVSHLLSEDLEGFDWVPTISFEEQPGGVGYPAPAPVDPAEGMDMTDVPVTSEPVDLNDPELGKIPESLAAALDQTGVAPRRAADAPRPTKRVWAIADSMKGAARKEVIAACVAEGINAGTARTQYQHWFSANKKA
jgi:hypothetical protein